MAVKALLVMDDRRRARAAHDLQTYGVEFAESADLRTARQTLWAHRSLETVIVDATLSDCTWCSLVSELKDAGLQSTILVCADRQNQLLCGEVVSRAGYYAVAPPHEWRPLRDVIPPSWGSKQPAANRTPATQHRSGRVSNRMSSVSTSRQPNSAARR